MVEAVADWYSSFVKSMQHYNFLTLAVCTSAYAVCGKIF